MVYKATMDYVRTIIILVELNGRYFTRPDVYMYVCSLCTVTDDPMGNCLWWWDSPTWVSDSLLIPAYLPAFPLLILTSKVWISENNNSSSTKDIESVVLTNWLGGGGGSSISDKGNMQSRYGSWFGEETHQILEVTLWLSFPFKNFIYLAVLGLSCSLQDS